MKKGLINLTHEESMALLNCPEVLIDSKFTFAESFMEALDRFTFDDIEILVDVSEFSKLVSAIRTFRDTRVTIMEHFSPKGDSPNKLAYLDFKNENKATNSLLRKLRKSYIKLKKGL